MDFVINIIINRVNMKDHIQSSFMKYKRDPLAIGLKTISIIKFHMVDT